MLTCSVILSGSIILLSSWVYIYTYTYITHTSRCKTHRSICAVTRCYESSEVPVVACIEYMSILWLRLHFLLWRSSEPKALQVLPHQPHPFHMELDFAQHDAKSRKTRKKTQDSHHTYILSQRLPLFTFVYPESAAHEEGVRYMSSTSGCLQSPLMSCSTPKLMENLKTHRPWWRKFFILDLPIFTCAVHRRTSMEDWLHDSFAWPLKLPSEGSCDLRARNFLEKQLNAVRFHNNVCIRNNWKETLEIGTCVVVHHPLLQSRPQSVINSARCQWFQFPHPPSHLHLYRLKRAALQGFSMFAMLSVLHETQNAALVYQCGIGKLCPKAWNRAMAWAPLEKPLALLMVEKNMRIFRITG